MFLKNIKINTVFHIRPEIDNEKMKEEWTGDFYQLVSNAQALVKGRQLYNGSLSLPQNHLLHVRFFEQSNAYAFEARSVRTVQRSGLYLTQMEQLTDIETSTRREGHREEIKVNVRLYGILPEDLPIAHTLGNQSRVEYSAISQDISHSGLRLLSDHRLYSDYDPYFLAEFILNRTDVFLLPVKRVRKTRAQSLHNQYDYGFQFIYDAIPSEKERLKNALQEAVITGALR